MTHADIRIGTLASLEKGAAYLKQILPHGFESFSLTSWKQIGNVDLKRSAKEIMDVLGDRAVVSSVGLFGNPLQDENCARDIARCIDAAPLFKCSLFTGFAGAIEGRPLPESMPAFKKVWSELVKRAEDKGVRIAWENCDMGGTWDAPLFNIAHAPSPAPTSGWNGNPATRWSR